MLFRNLLVDEHARCCERPSGTYESATGQLQVLLDLPVAGSSILNAITFNLNVLHYHDLNVGLFLCECRRRAPRSDGNVVYTPGVIKWPHDNEGRETGCEETFKDGYALRIGG